MGGIPVGVYSRECLKYWSLIARVLSSAYLKLRGILEVSGHRYELFENVRRDLRYFVVVISEILKSRRCATFAICDEMREGGGSLTRAVSLGYRLLGRSVRGVRRCDLLVHVRYCSIILVEYTERWEKGEKPELPMQQIKNVYALYDQLKKRRNLRRWLNEAGLPIKADLDNEAFQRDFDEHGGLAIIVVPFVPKEFERRHLFMGLYVSKKPRRGGRILPHKAPYMLFIKVNELSATTLESYF